MCSKAPGDLRIFICAPINDTASTKVPRLGYHASFKAAKSRSLPEPPEKQYLHALRHDVRGQKVKGQESGWANLIASSQTKC